jgi:Mn2+/Fe2+ NRAMP family transporter
VIDGVVSVPIMLMMMLVAANRKIIGRFTIHVWLHALGWYGIGRHAKMTTEG